MKALLVCFFLILLVSTASAVNLNAIVTDSIAVADTVTDAVRADTTYSGTYNVSGKTYLHPFVEISTVDTNWTGDKFYFWLQHSWDNVNWTTSHCTDSTLGTTGTAIGGQIWSATDSVLGKYVRLMAVHRDSAETNLIDLVTNTYTYRFTLWLEAR